MMISGHFPMDREIAAFEQALTENKVIICRSNDPSKDLHAIFQQAFKQLLVQKKVLIVANQTSIKNDFVTLLDRYGLSAYTLNLDVGESISDQVHALFQKANIPHKCISHEHLNQLDQFLAKAEDKITEHYTSLQEGIFGSKSIIDLSLAYNKVKNIVQGDEKTLGLNAHYFCFSEEEFWSIRKNIHEAIKRYNPIFNVFDDNEILVNFSANENFSLDSQTLIPELTKQIDAIQEIIRFTHSSIDQYLQDLVNSSLALQEHVLKALNDLQEQLIFVHYQSSNKKSSFLSLKKKDKIDLEPLQEQYNNCIDQLKSNQIFQQSGQSADPILSSTAITNLYEDIESLQPQKENFADYIDRLNLNHLSADRRASLLERINDPLSVLNESKILDEEIEFSAFTFKHQLGSLEDTLQYLRNARELNEQLPSYIAWREFSMDQSRELKHILDKFKIHPSNQWLYLFEAWYIRKIIEQNEWRFQRSGSEQFDYPTALNNKVLTEKFAYMHHHLAKQKETAKQQLKKNQKTIYQKIFSKQNEPINWKEVIDKAPSFILDFFPIILIDEPGLTYLMELIPESSWSQCFYFDTPKNASVSSDKLGVYANNISYHIPQSPTYEVPEKLESEVTVQTVDMTVDFPQRTLALADINFSDRLAICQKIAANLMDLVDNYKIYQTKDHSIISFWSQHNNHILEAQLESLHVKEILISERRTEVLVEAFLDTSKSTVVLFEDGLLNSHTPETYNWQFYLIQCLQSMGTHCFNSWSYDKYKYGNISVKQICDEIQQLNQVESPSDNETPESQSMNEQLQDQH